MALTAEQQAQLDFNLAQAEAGAKAAKELEDSRRQHELTLDTRRTKLELLRTAKEVLIENRRNAPVGEREVTDSDVIQFATQLKTFIDN